MKRIGAFRWLGVVVAGCVLLGSVCAFDDDGPIRRVRSEMLPAIPQDPEVSGSVPLDETGDISDESPHSSGNVDVDSYEIGQKETLGGLSKEHMEKYRRSLDMAAYLASEVQIMLRLRTFDYTFFENNFTPNWDLAKDIGFAVVGAGMGTLSMLGSLGVDIGMRFSDFQDINSIYSTQNMFNTIMSAASEYQAYVDGRSRMIAQNGGSAPLLMFSDTPMGSLYTAYCEVFEMVKDPEVTARFIQKEMRNLLEDSTSKSQIAACKASSNANSLTGKIVRGVGHIGMGVIDCLTVGATLPFHAGFTAGEIAADTAAKVLRASLEKKKLKLLLLGVYLLEKNIRGRRNTDVSGEEYPSGNAFHFCSIVDHSKPNFGCAENHFCQRNFLFHPENSRKFFEAERSPSGFCAPRKSRLALKDGASCLDDSDCASSFCMYNELIIPNSNEDIDYDFNLESNRSEMKIISPFNGIAPPDKDPDDDELPDWTSTQNSRWVKVGLEIPRWAESPALPQGMDRGLLKGTCASAVSHCEDDCEKVKGPLHFKVLRQSDDSGLTIARHAVVDRRRNEQSRVRLGVDSTSESLRETRRRSEDW